jgi:hypothetical protein
VLVTIAGTNKTVVVIDIPETGATWGLAAALRPPGIVPR